MLRLDTTRLTPETVRFAKQNTRVAIKTVLAYCIKHRVNLFKVISLYNRLRKISARAYQMRTIDPVAIDGIIPLDALHRFAPLSRHVAEKIAEEHQKRHAFPDGARFEEVDVGTGRPAEWCTVPGSSTGKVFMYIHGGGWFTGSPRASRAFTAAVAAGANVRAFSPSYRFLPDHAHPAQIDDVTAAYKWLLASGVAARDVVVGGESAGAHLALLLLLRAKREGIGPPAGAVLMSPPADMTMSGPSIFPNMPSDPVLGTSGMGVLIQNLVFHAKTDPKDPGFSPILADLGGLPPMLVQVSSSESLYSDATRLVEKVKASGGEATLQEWGGVQHAFQMEIARGSKAAAEACAKVVEFVRQRLDA
ncbi:MAG: alpha/beta fold hydrolase [Candidatus Lokiarchaeota archaeon]|nr:alpha/beta fold hydrolase [Candidatus Lokiarchaeota archaeon]